jgi:hypothetical protein
VLVKRPLVPTLILIAASFALLRPGGGLVWSSVAPSFQEMERQVKVGLESLRAFRFQAPSLSPLSIPYLTIKEAREEASLQQQNALQETTNR